MSAPEHPVSPATRIVCGGRPDRMPGSPVVAPIALGSDGHTYNVNADTMAGAIAAAIGASRFFLLTDVPGVLDKSGQLMPELTPADVA